MCVCGPFEFAITVLRRRRLPAFDGHPQALRHAVDPDDASRAKHPGALHRELPDWAATHTATVSPGSIAQFTAAMYERAA